MKHAALSMIRDEHQALAAMLRSMLMLLDKSRKDRVPPSFDVLRAMLFCIDEFFLSACTTRTKAGCCFRCSGRQCRPWALRWTGSNLTTTRQVQAAVSADRDDCPSADRAWLISTRPRDP